MARRKNNPEEHLPEKAPKRTGKRGIKPVEAFAEANEILAGEGDVIDAEYTEVEETEQPEETEQSEVLLEMPENDQHLALVMNDRMLVHYIKPHFKKTKKGERTIALEFSTPLTDEHEEHLPKLIASGWKILQKKGMKKLDVDYVPPQVIKIWLADDQEKEALILPAVAITNVSLATVQQKGEGQARKVIRLSFRALTKMTAQVGRFAEFNYDDKFWLSMHELQEEMFEDEEPDE